MTLYDKLTAAFTRVASNATPGNNWVVGENNRVPEMLAKIAVRIVDEHNNDDEQKETIS